MADPVEDHLQCPSCLDIFHDPVILPCSHSFCRECVRRWWQQKSDRSCPVCRTQFKSLDPPMNLALRKVCEAFSRAPMESEDVCSLHKEKLKLFCWDHKKLVCVICRDSEIHAGHKFRPVDEVVKAHQEKLGKNLKYVRRRLEYSKKKRDKYIEQAEHIKVQWERVERKIKEDFEELRGFLQAEEDARLAAVRDEEQKKSRSMKENIAALSKDMAALLEVIRSAEEQLTSDPVSSMKNFQAATVRNQKLPGNLEPLPPGALLDEAKHVGNLKFSVWERMKRVVSYSPVILDPNTAGSKLRLSDDLTGVSFQVGQQRPSNAERLKGNIVLGSALVSATRKWDVEVGDNTDWKVGVAWGDPCLPSAMLQSSIGFCNGRYRIFADTLLGSWNPPMKLQRIRVHVDVNERSITFSECQTNTILCKKNPSDWPHSSDNINMYPYFYTKDVIPLQIIPLPAPLTTSSPRL
ncbi:E3 ubiquitin-protein ligase TRIM35-like [Vanacampus margaritifer]